MTQGYDNYCSHEWIRDDMNTKQCVKCHRYKGVDECQ